MQEGRGVLWARGCAGRACSQYTVDSTSITAVAIPMNIEPTCAAKMRRKTHSLDTYDDVIIAGTS